MRPIELEIPMYDNTCTCCGERGFIVDFVDHTCAYCHAVITKETVEASKKKSKVFIEANK
jgi:hypothetical protein